MPADYRTTVTAVLDAPGLVASSVENGSRLRFEWRGAGTLVVLDEDGAPFLRLTPAGVETNLNSRLAYTSRDRRGLTEVPADVDGAGEPRWERTSSTPEVLWHEHRAHWTQTSSPPGSGERRVRDWTVPLLVEGRPGSVTGSLDYVPGPSPLPYAALALLATVAAAAAVRAGRPGVLACLVVLAADVTRALGTGLAAADEPVQALLSAVGLAGVGWVLLVAAVVGILRERAGAVVIAAIGGALVALSGALPASSALIASLPLTEWPALVQRGAVAVSLGAGLGLLLGLIAAFQRLSAAVPPAPAP